MQNKLTVIKDSEILYIDKLNGAVLKGGKFAWVSTKSSDKCDCFSMLLQELIE